MAETTSVLRGGIVVNEILVDPNGAVRNFDTNNNGTAEATDEFIELYNISNTSIDISGLELWDANAKNWYTVPGGTILQAKAYAYVLVGNDGGLAPVPNSDTLVLSAERGQSVFNNPGDNVVLYDPTADEYVQFTYNNDAADDPTTYTGFSATASRVGSVEDWGSDFDGVSLARTVGADTRVLKQDRILDANAGQPTATPGRANSGGSEADDVIIGSNLSDRLSGGTGNDTVSGGEGDDQIWGNADDDILSGDGGDDWISGGLGNDTLNGGEGVDQLYGYNGADVLNGGAGADELFGGNDGDTLNGDAGDDKLMGHDGDDTLNGGGLSAGENDTLFGGAGADTFILGEGDTVFYLSDGPTSSGRGNADKAIIQDFSLADGDSIQLSGVASDYKIETYSSGTKSRIVYQQDDIIAIFSNNIATQGVDLATAAGISFVTAPPQDFTGTENVDQFVGGGGDDVASGLGAGDLLSGGGGADTLYGDDGDDVLSGGAGDDSLYGGKGNDQMSGDAGDDRLQGGGGNDLLLGGGLGAGERDVLIGNGGADTFVLGSAEDVFYDGGVGSRGSQDRAVIQDFNLSQGDRIQIKGSAEDYTIESYSSGTKSRLIYTANQSNEIIASFATDITTQNVSLEDGTGFVFV